MTVSPLVNVKLYRLDNDRSIRKQPIRSARQDLRKLRDVFPTVRKRRARDASGGTRARGSQQPVFVSSSCDEISREIDLIALNYAIKLKYNDQFPRQSVLSVFPHRFIILMNRGYRIANILSGRDLTVCICIV